MNYLKQIIEFEKVSDALPITSNAKAMYYALLRKNNELRWIKIFTLSNTVLKELSKIKHNTTFNEARDNLIKTGLIKYTKGTQKQAGSYTIIELNGVHVSDGVLVHVLDHVADGVTLYKYKYKQNVNNKYIYSRAKSTTTEINFQSVVKEVIDYLNKQLNTNYKYNNKNTINKINNKLKDGYSITDFKKVIDNKTAEWLGTKYQKYLRPETLFGNKFESYLYQQVIDNEKPELLNGNFENLDALYE